MVRGLIIRQLFLVTNLVLACLILFAAATVVKQLLKTPAGGTVPPVDLAALAPASGEIVEELRERSAYNSILENGLFGAAGRFKADEKPVVEEPVLIDDNPTEETALSLKLWAVTSLSPRSPFASASIEDTSQRSGSQIYHIGSAVVENVILEEVHKDWVLLLNKQKTPAVRERLSLYEEDKVIANAATSNNQNSRATVLPSERVDLDKNAFVQELYVNYADLVTKVKPELYRDASGNVAGITAADISDVPLAKQLGLENGDVLQTVNNERIDSEQKILEMVQKYQDAGSFRIGIMRNGKQKIITYNFR